MGNFVDLIAMQNRRQLTQSGNIRYYLILFHSNLLRWTPLGELKETAIGQSDRQLYSQVSIYCVAALQASSWGQSDRACLQPRSMTVNRAIERRRPLRMPSQENVRDARRCYRETRCLSVTRNSPTISYVYGRWRTQTPWTEKKLEPVTF